MTVFTIRDAAPGLSPLILSIHEPELRLRNVPKDKNKSIALLGQMRGLSSSVSKSSFWQALRKQYKKCLCILVIFHLQISNTKTLPFRLCLKGIDSRYGLN